MLVFLLPMSSDTKLSQAISLIKQGHKAEARHILTEIVETDTDNEIAWLWLSAAVDNNEDRITCLRNVLTINPENEKARKRLINLQAATPEIEPSYTADIANKNPPIISYQSHSSFDDVWPHAEELRLCGYCAKEVNSTQKRCPQCLRKLTRNVLTYTKTSNHFHVYWVLIAGLSQLMAIQTIIDVLSDQSQQTIIAHGALVPVYLGLVPFIYQRRFWAYAIAQIALFVTAGLLVTAAMFPSLSATMPAILGTPLAGLFDGASLLSGSIIRVLQTTASVIAFFYGAFLVPGDFAQTTIWLYARLNGDLRGRANPSRAHAAAERYAKRGLWATAAVHWRRAQAGAPTNLTYYYRLADAYTRLNFLDRALDTIQSGFKIASAAEAKARLEDLKVAVLHKQKK